MRAKLLSQIEDAVRERTLYGSSPPSVFVGEYGYPKVLAGPAIPPITGESTALMERPDLWLDRTMDEIVSFRFSLIRTKKFIPIDTAPNPTRLLAETQTLALSEAPAVSEALLLKRPTFTSIISNTTLPLGPSAPLDAFELDENPKVPRVVDKITSDTDLKAGPGIIDLFDGGIRQEHVIRLLSIGLLGQEKRRRLVPTKWSITAVDDTVGKHLHKQVLRFPWINDYWVCSDYALGNKVILLFLPSAWQFEAMECWLSGPDPWPINDYEWFKGRKTYANSVVGAYYATREPALRYLVDIRRQAGVIVFMEIDPAIWVPMGVWRFREIARRALTKPTKKYPTLEIALEEIGKTLTSPMYKWLQTSQLIKEFKSQTKLTDFLK
jgi:hypothetical protein